MVPRPDAAGHDRLGAERAVEPDHVAVEVRLVVIVIPIDELHVPGDFRDDVGRDDAVAVVVVAGFGAEPEIHVAPDHRAKAALAAEVAHAGEVVVEDVERALLAVELLEPARADAVRLVHPEVDAPRLRQVLCQCQNQMKLLKVVMLLWELVMITQKKHS